MSRCSFLVVSASVLLLCCAREHENIVHVIAERAPGLKKSARVQFRGVEVGQVKQVYFTPGGVRIDLVGVVRSPRGRAQVEHVRGAVG